MKIGIFWIYQGTVCGEACLIGEGEESIPGLVDSNFSHYETWELNDNFTHPFPELIGSEYQKYPRGRVLYVKKDKQFLIYLDKQINNKNSKNLIRDYFSLKSQKIKWLSDPHYVTSDDKLSCLFD